MDWDTAKQAIDYLFDHSSKRENIYLTFYGGEPLLKFDLIKQCTDYAQQQAELKGRNLYFNLTTNLSLMTEEIANYLAAIPHFSIAVSIDGPAECNAARVYANGIFLVNEHIVNKNKLETGIIPVSSLLCGKQKKCALN